MALRSIALLGFPDHISQSYTAITSPGPVPVTLPLTNLQTDEPSEITRITSTNPLLTQFVFDFSAVESDIDGFVLVNYNLAPGSEYRFVGLIEGNEAGPGAGPVTSWPYIETVPNALAASSNRAGAVTVVDEPISSPDGLTMEPSTASLPWSVRFSFPAMAIAQNLGSRMAAFVIRVQRRFSGAGATAPLTYPRVTADLREQGSPASQALGFRAVQVVAPDTQILIFPFSFTQLANPDGADLELELTFTPGTSVSGVSYGVLESVAVLYEALSPPIVGISRDTGWLTVRGVVEDAPTASDSHFPETPWEDIQTLLLLIRTDQSNHNPPINANSGLTPVAALEEMPDTYVDIGIVEAGAAKFFKYGILTPGPLTSPQTHELGEASLAGQSYGADAFAMRVSDAMTLTVTREEADWLRREIGWKKGLNSPFYVAMEPDIAPEHQMFTAFWATLADNLGAPRKIGDYKPDETMMMEISIRFKEKL